nr:hypothetical protein BaRGS_007977 [Batillaria attramentaria]
MIGKYCGNTPPNGGSINTTHNQVYFWFKSDASVSGNGFTVNWASADPVCGADLSNATHGTVNSPGYPGNYPHNRDCVWTIAVPPGNNILIQFAYLAIEHHDNCSYDYLEIRAGQLASSPLLQQYCGVQTTTPAPITVLGPYAYIRFHTDSSLNDRGFHITYSAVSTTVITLSDIQRIIDQQTRVIDEKLGPLRADISDVRTSVQAIATDIAELKQRTLTLETSCEKLSDRHDDLVESVEDLAEDLKDLQARYEEEIDKLEAFSRRDNLRLFGLAETPNETFESCAAKVIECLQGTVPNKTWSEDDVVRAHRVGKKPNFSSVASNTTPKSRPMIVKFARWRDKMDILTKGRTALKAKGVNVAGDLTTRQHQKIQEHRDRGLRAYYKGSKLVVAGPLQQRNDIDSFGRRRQDTVSSGDDNHQGRRATNRDRGRDGDQVHGTTGGKNPRATLSSQQLPSPKPPKRRRPPSSPSGVEVDPSQL